jgi:hypothetical protein
MLSAAIALGAHTCCFYFYEANRELEWAGIPDAWHHSLTMYRTTSGDQLRQHGHMCLHCFHVSELIQDKV